MIDKHYYDRVQIRAYEKYLERINSGDPEELKKTADDDWAQAEAELCDRRQITSCPKCNFPLLTRKDDNITCLSNTCDWQVKAKRDTDSKIPTIQELKKDWNGG